MSNVNKRHESRRYFTVVKLFAWLRAQAA
jgi:hypothetical protein